MYFNQIDIAKIRLYITQYMLFKIRTVERIFFIIRNVQKLVTFCALNRLDG